MKLLITCNVEKLSKGEFSYMVYFASVKFSR